MGKVEKHIAAIGTALRAANRYSPSLDLQIYALASALRALDLANADMDSLDCTTVKTPHGIQAHPVFRIRKEAEDSVTRQMKALGLTAAELAGVDDNDPLIELTRKVIDAPKKKPRVVKPKK